MEEKTYDEVNQSYWDGDNVTWYAKWEVDKFIELMKCCGNCKHVDYDQGCMSCSIHETFDYPECYSWKLKANNNQLGE